MENVLISIFLFELFFTMLLVINCAVDELLPIGEYKTWLQNRNWFGKIYIFITIIFTPVYNFINDRLVDESAVLRPLSWHLILYVFRYFSRKWQKISDCECPDLIQNKTPVRFLYGTQKNVRSDRAESSWHSN